MDGITAGGHAERRRGWYVPPLVPVAVGLVSGIASEAVVVVPLWVCVVGFAGCGVVLAGVLRGRRAGVGMLVVGLAGAWVGAGLHHVHYRRVERNHVVLHASAEGVLVRLRGRVVSEPVVANPQPGHFARWLPTGAGSRFVLRADQIESAGGAVSVVGVVRVGLVEPVPSVHAGDRVEVLGRLYRFGGVGNPGQFDWAGWQRRRRVLVGLAGGVCESVRVIERDQGGWWRRFRGGFCGRAERYLLADVGSADGQSHSLLRAMVLGQRSRVAREVDEAFVRTGTAHLLSVSGIHVGLLALFGWWLGRLVGLRHLAAAVVVLVLVAAYMVLAEPRPPILRAGILAMLACVAAAMRRSTDTANWLAAGAIVILAVRPTDLFSAGFQLSFGVVLAVLYLARRVRRALFGNVYELERLEVTAPDEYWSRQRRRWLLGKLDWALAIAIAAWLVGAPLVAYHFERWSPWGWLNSLLVGPVAAVVMLIGFSKLLLAALLPSTCLLTGPMLAGATAVLKGWVGTLSQLPLCSVHTRGPPVVLLVGWYGLLVLWTVVLSAAWARLLRLGAVGLVVGFVWWSAPGRQGGQELVVHVLSVGHGAATLIELPNGKTLLYDAGSLGPYNVAASAIVPAMHSLGLRRIDAAVISHPNIDHYCGLLDLADGVPLGKVFVSPHFGLLSRSSGPSGYLLEQLEERGISVGQVKAGDRLGGTGQVGVEVLWPPLPGGQCKLEANDTSVVLRLGYAGRRMLLTGDIEDPAQRLLLGRADLACDVLLVPHHGSVVPMTEPFMVATDAEWVINSSNLRGERRARKLSALLPERARLLNTADAGCVSVYIGPDGMSVRPFRSGRVGSSSPAGASLR